METTTHTRKPRCTLPSDCIPIACLAAVAALPVGSHLVTPRRSYVHHGIYVGGGRVVHYAGMCHTLRPLPVQEVAVPDFANGHPVGYLPRPLAQYSGQAAVARARSRLGEDAYDLLTNNCEHFCTWVLHGEARSEQVERLMALPGRVVTRMVARIRQQTRQARADIPASYQRC